MKLKKQGPMEKPGRSSRDTFDRELQGRSKKKGSGESAATYAGQEKGRSEKSQLESERRGGGVFVGTRQGRFEGQCRWGGRLEEDAEA